MWVHPIKSCAGVRVDAALARPEGLEHDRRWMIVDGAGRFVSARTHPQLVRIGTAIDAAHYVATRPDGATLRIPHRHEGDAIATTLWGRDVEAIPHAEGSAFFSDHLGQDVRLVYQPSPRAAHSAAPEAEVSLADGYPYLLLGEASVEALDGKLDVPVGERRFRANLLIAGAPAHAEDGWARVRIGDVVFRGVKRCERCVLTTVDPATGTKGREPLRTLAGYRREDGKVWFGMNLVPELREPTELRTGAPVEPLP